MTTVAAPTSAPDSIRTHQLQAIRGLAALLVAVGHCLGVFATPAWFSHLKNYSNGHAAVVMFFVLSGFVLTLSQKASADSPASFYIKRLFRIYPAWIVACTVSLAYLALVHYRFPIADGSDWWTSRFLVQRFKPLFVLASYGGASAFLLPQGWTIAVELVASLLMPLVAYLAYRRRGLLYLAMAAALVLSLTIGSHTVYGLLSYLVDFFLGAWLATPPGRFVNWVRSSASWSSYSLVLALVVLISYRVTFPAPGGELDAAAYNDGFSQGVEALCCVWILAFLIYGARASRWLDAGGLARLGEVSYSFYLLHVPIMCALATLVAYAPLGPVLRSLLLLAVTLPISFAVAMVSYRWIERPGIALGRRLGLAVIPRTQA
jgi:peptidoglycan/LPS O-acetylase OafA/YrhL